ncbi:cysteine hydrolase family protein [Azospirillum picis]|uniref:Nicotinamidase-related amidase n=1 Tax=Azospirillum picis TaxID=488438 RepID=A0ABU0MIB3_9PROT|nr:cysteine hydrolase family protein [Azospirillum picis]MBP2299396.1 nicotinamidase-related amidase [Azospirillum picis]MDQ0532966.1 nicotinamidase-related amidase [Azospirillum picis]
MIQFPPATLLLAVDMQRAFDGPSWPRRWNREADRNGLRLLEGWRRSGRPILHVRHDSAEPDSSLRPGQDGNRFRDGFEPCGGEGVVSKSVNAAFIGTDLDLRLRRLGVERLVVFGISTDMCVSTTVRTGANMGWKITLAADACDCFELPDGRGGTIPAEQVQAVHVATLGFEFCEVATTAGILGRL